MRINVLLIHNKFLVIYGSDLEEEEKTWQFSSFKIFDAFKEIRLFEYSVQVLKYEIRNVRKFLEILLC